AAERAVVVRRRIRPEREPVALLRLIAEMVEDHSGLDARELPLRVDLEHPGQVLREVEYHRHVDALAGEARAAAARDDRRAELVAERNRRDDVVDRAWQDDSDRQLPVVRPGRRPERAVAG